LSDPSFRDLRADARMVCDHPGRKLAVYPNADGDVVLVSEEYGKRTYTEIQPAECELLFALVMRAAAEGSEIQTYLESQYQTYLAIEHAKGAD
jgi:hypothetical protein